MRCTSRSSGATSRRTRRGGRSSRSPTIDVPWIPIAVDGSGQLYVVPAVRSDRGSADAISTSRPASRRLIRSCRRRASTPRPRWSSTATRKSASSACGVEHRRRDDRLVRPRAQEAAGARRSRGFPSGSTGPSCSDCLGDGALLVRLATPIAIPATYCDLSSCDAQRGRRSAARDARVDPRPDGDARPAPHQGSRRIGSAGLGDDASSARPRRPRGGRPGPRRPVDARNASGDGTTTRSSSHRAATS